MAVRLRLMRALIGADALSFARDPLFAFLIALPLVVALILRFFWPGLEALLLTRLDFALAPFRPMMMGVFAGMSASLIGATFGLLLVEERDARTLAALRVTPASFAAILAARLAGPTAFAAAMTILCYPLAGLTPLPVLTVTAIALSAATTAPVAALVIITFASNKVAGLVAFRLVNTALALPALAFLASPALALLAWPVSAYWPMKALWLAAEGRVFWPHLLVAPVLNALLGYWLLARFARRAEP